jgi:hypothetical protein
MELNEFEKAVAAETASLDAGEDHSADVVAC